MGNAQEKQADKSDKLQHSRSLHNVSKNVSNNEEITRRKSVNIKKNVTTKDDKYDKHVKKEDPIISLAQKDIIESSWEQGSTGSIGNRIYLRVFEKRPDLQYLFDAMGRDKWEEQGRSFTLLLGEIVGLVSKLDEVTRLCGEWGQRHVELKTYGFKPDFWVTMADAMTTECLYLDAGAHPPADVIGSWASLISLMVSSMRDGYYDRLRKQRRQSQKLRRQSTLTSDNSSCISNNEPSVNSTQDPSEITSRAVSSSPRRSLSQPAGEDISKHYPGKMVFESANTLYPDNVGGPISGVNTPATGQSPESSRKNTQYMLMPIAF